MQCGKGLAAAAVLAIAAGIGLRELRAQSNGAPEPQFQVSPSSGGVRAPSSAGAPSTSAAHGGGRGSTAVIDIVKVFNDFQQTMDLNAQFDQRRKEVQLEVDTRDGELNQRMRELEAFHPDSPEYGQRRREVLKLQIDRDNYLRLAEADVRDQFKLWTERTYVMICETAAKVAQERGFDMVMTTEALDSDVPDANALKQQIRLRHVIYANPAVDITQDVLARLNRDYSDKEKKPSVDKIGP